MVKMKLAVDYQTSNKRNGFSVGEICDNEVSRYFDKGMVAERSRKQCLELLC